MEVPLYSYSANVYLTGQPHFIWRWDYYILNSGFDAKKYADAIFAYFGPGTVYEKARQQSGTPKQGPWTNHALKIMIANRENGDTPEADANSKDPDGLCKAIALVRQPDGNIKPCVNTTQVWYN